MPEYNIIKHNRVTEEFFSDPGEAKARAAVLARDPGAESISESVSRNYDWMDDDAVWYCVRWTSTRPEETP
jgi:hypothetical protein